MKTYTKEEFFKAITTPDSPIPDEIIYYRHNIRWSLCGCVRSLSRIYIHATQDGNRLLAYDACSRCQGLGSPPISWDEVKGETK
jgi:hypothetical protein